MNRTEKQNAVADLAKEFKSSAAVFLADYRGLKVEEMTQLRSELYEVDGRLQVVKNRLMKHALGGGEGEGLAPFLKGPLAITFVKEDPVGAAKVLFKYQKKFEPLEIRAGYMRGDVMQATEVEALAKLPSKEELYAKLLATMLGPASSLVRVLQGTSEKLARVMAALRDTKE